MQPIINKAAFGWIQIDGQKYSNDVVIELDGNIRKRRKKLSKALYGTSHIISLAEAQDVTVEGMHHLLIGSGMFDSVRLSDEATDYFQKRAIEVVILPTNKALQYWNESEQQLVGLFHITC